MKKLCFALFVAAQVFIFPGAFTSMAMDDTSGTSNLDAGKGFIIYKNYQISAEIDEAPLGDVVKTIEIRTGAQFILKDSAIVNYPLSVKIKEVTLEEALKRIFKHYSYAMYYNSVGQVNRVVIFGAKDSAAKVPVRSAMQPMIAAPPVLDTSQSTSAETIIEESYQSADDSPASAASQQTSREVIPLADADDSGDESPAEEADAPFDLDDYQPLPEELSNAGMFDPGTDDMQDPESMRLAVEEQEARQERLNQAKFERSLNALNSDYPHLRSMAVDELVSLKDPRAAAALAGAASLKELAPDERRRIAEALWHHAADLEYANPTANGALQQMASDGDPAVQEIARKALLDMERYRRRLNRE